MPLQQSQIAGDKAHPDCVGLALTRRHRNNLE